MRYRKGKIVIENDVPASIRSRVLSQWAMHFDLRNEALLHTLASPEFDDALKRRIDRERR